MASKVHQVQPDRLDLQAHKETLARLVQTVSQVQLVNLDLMEMQEHRVLLDSLDHKDQLVHQDL